MSFNKLIAYGRVGRDIELRTSKTGGSYCNFSIATSEKRGEVENTTWFSVTAHGKQAELIQKYVHKGDDLYIEGTLTLGSYEDKVTHKTIPTAEVRCTDFKLIGKPKPQAQAAAATASKGKATKGESAPEPATTDDIPF